MVNEMTVVSTVMADVTVSPKPMNLLEFFFFLLAVQYNDTYA